MRILLLEDDKQLCSLVVAYLNKDLLVDYAHNIDDVKSYINIYKYDVILLDRNIDNEDIGLSLISIIKKKNPQTAIIVISAYGTVSDKINGLNLGADDYLEKPFDNDELLARIYAQGRKQIVEQVIKIQSLSFDLINTTITTNDNQIILSKKESDILFYLLNNINEVISNEELINAIYLHPEEVSSSTIRVTIGNIRKKLSIDIIKTIKTRGYIIENL